MLQKRFELVTPELVVATHRNDMRHASTSVWQTRNLDYHVDRRRDLRSQDVHWNPYVTHEGHRL